MRFVIMLLIPFYSFSQPVLQGVVINKTTQDKVPFASVSLIKAKAVVNTNENGVFKLSNFTIIPNDTLIVTSIGFFPMKIAVDKNGNGSLKIELTEIIHNLKEVVVRNNNFKNNTTLNEFDKFHAYYGDGTVISQVAQHFVSPSANAMLKNIKIDRNSIPILSPQKTIFRLRFYAVDSISKAPSYDLTDQIIEVNSKSKIVELNVEKYNIYLPNKDFFVAIEWLRIPYNAEEIKFKGGTKTTYAPSIGFSQNSAPFMDVWQLRLNNVWDKIPSYMVSNLAIAVSINY